MIGQASHPSGVRFVVELQVEGDNAIRRMQAALKDFRPAWRKVGNVIRRTIRQNFLVAGRPEHWKPLAPNTLVAKGIIGPQQGWPYATPQGRQRVRRLQQMAGGTMQRSVANILIARGDLRDSYAQSGTRNHVQRISKDRIEEGSKHWLAAIHEFGTGEAAGKGKYPIRPRRAKSLKFFTTGGVVYRQLVMHPGVPARPAAILQPQDVNEITLIVKEHLRG